MLRGLAIITEDGVTHQLLGEGSPIKTIFLDGVGLPNIRRLMDRAPLQHGVTDRGFRIDERTLTLSLMIDGLTPAEADTLRDKVAYIFSPSNDPLTLVVERDDGVVKQLNVFANGLIDFPQSIRMGGGQRIVVPLIAPDPFWYEPEQQTASITSATSPIQITIPIVEYGWDDWPIIQVTGPVDAGTQIQSRVGISTPTTLVALLEINPEMTGIPSGETWEIDTRPSFKTIRRTSDNATRMQFFTPHLLVFFSLMKVHGAKTARTIHPGAIINRFVLTGTGFGATTTLTVKWYKRYLTL
jgi:hypothetical protein